MRKLNLSKLLVVLPMLGYSFGAAADITVDGSNNVSFTGSKNSALSIAADGSVSVNGKVIHKCEGNESGKVTKTKTATVTCDANYVTVHDRAGNELSRFSSYAMSTDAAHNTDRKLFDPSIAQFGSGVTGASALQQTQSTTIETTKEVVVEKKVTPATTNVATPAPAKVNETIFTPKLGAVAEKTPSETLKDSPQQYKADKAEEKAAEQNWKITPSSTPSAASAITETPQEVIINTTEKPVESQEVIKTTTTTVPTPNAAAAGIAPTTTTDTTTAVVPTPADATPNAASSILQSPGVGN